jgi:tRNA pseudouridine38-40 synthase
MRYFIEVSYDGTEFSGFQVQENANTIQAEVERALRVFAGQAFALTGSSRTDAGVHALQNYFHTDSELVLTERQVYNLNALLPPTIAVNSLRRVRDDAHCRFDATAREYRYYLHRKKNVFALNRSWHYPYAVDLAVLNSLAELVKQQTDFEAFCKRNAQVATYRCQIAECVWTEQPDGLMLYIRGNRFLRGMVRGLVSTMLKLSRRPDPLQRLQEVFDSHDCRQADFTAPGCGLFLAGVQYPEGVWEIEEVGGRR